MFSRIMAMVVAAIMLVAVGVAVTGGMALRNQQINARVEDLKKEAREIAYLAAQRTPSVMGAVLGADSANARLINWKAEAVFKEYGAYILVVDRRGRVMDNMRLAYSEDPAFAASLNGQEIASALAAVLGGQEVALRTTVAGDPSFLVGVPFVQENTVLGAVLIRTKAQAVEAGIGSLITQVGLMALAAILIAAAGVYLYVRSVMRPLGELTRAARAMSEGDFAVRVAADDATPEVAEVSAAFNSMAGKLAEVESSRREFVANVSHELRSPITSISGFVEGMEDGTIPPEEHPHYLAVVGQETRRLSKLIGDLLALSRLERDDVQLEYTTFDIHEMLRRAIIRRVNDLEGKAMEVDCRFAQENCLVHADADRVEQVVVNLLDNAIKFTPTGGKITLTTQVAEGRCHVTVQDNGAGILPEDRPRVFDRFFTADRARTAGKGTGLGLSICQRIMEMHGQSIVLEDTPTGAAFTFTLDVADHA